MADRPIPFKGPMVRAIIEDRKTQTRRVLDPQPGDLDRPFMMDDGSWHVTCSRGTHMSPLNVRYTIGDRLWVREAWRAPIAVDHLPPRDIWATTPVCYEADGSQQPRHGIEWGRYRHSMFMPRWASRITHIVESVRIERLQEISAAETISEGVQCATCISMHKSACLGLGCFASRQAFTALWTAINGPGSWETNPWVAAITFRSILANIDQIDANGRHEVRS
jgi:hypothetical protein